MQFEWNPEKEKNNIKKHGISFHEAATVLEDELSVTFPDPDHSFFEHRSLTIGLSKKGNLLVVVHTDRSNAIRMITARKATKKERKFYEEA